MEWYQIILGIALLLSICNAIATLQIKWYMHKNPPRQWEMEGDHIKLSYFKRMSRELRAKR